MKKKWLSMMLTLCVAAGTVMYPAGVDTVLAAEEKSSEVVPVAAAVSDVRETDGYKYRVISDGTVEIMHYTGTDTEPVVPDKIDGKQVTGIGELAFSEPDTGVKSVQVPNGVTYIGEHAFFACKSLESIALPDSVTTIGWSAFCGCSSLKSFTIPKGMKIIDDGVFGGCESLTDITIPDGVWRIGEAAFQSSGLKSITLPTSVTDVAEGAFRSCGSLKDVYYNGSKSQRKKMRVVGIGNKDLMQAVVHYEESGKSETLAPKKGAVLKSGRDSYKVNSEISSVAFTKTASTAASIVIPDFVEIDGILYRVTSIAANAFKNNKKVTKVTVQGSRVDSIGSGAFSGCSKLGTIIIKSSELKTVGSNAFKGIKPAAKIKVPSGQLAAYKKLMKGKGQGSKVTIVKWL